MAENRTSQVEDVRGAGIYPASGPFPPDKAAVRTPAALGHPEQREGLKAAYPACEPTSLLAGRIIFGGYFLYNGINHFVNRQMLVEYARSKGVPAADIAVPVSGLMLVAGGLSILAGTQPKIGAGLITAFLAGVSPQMHAFWKERDAQQRMHEMVNFTKNIALIGGSLFAAAQPEPWPWHPRLGRHGGALVPIQA